MGRVLSKLSSPWLVVYGNVSYLVPDWLSIVMSVIDVGCKAAVGCLVVESSKWNMMPSNI